MVSYLKNKNFVFFFKKIVGAPTRLSLIMSCENGKVNTMYTTNAHYVAFDDCWFKYVIKRKDTQPPSCHQLAFCQNGCAMDEFSDDFILSESKFTQKIKKPKKIFECFIGIPCRHDGRIGNR